MGVRHSALGRDHQVQLSGRRTHGQKVTWLCGRHHLKSGLAEERKKLTLELAAQRIIWRNTICKTDMQKRVGSQTYTIKTAIHAVAMQTERSADMADRARRDARAEIIRHRDSASRDRCPADAAHRES